MFESWEEELDEKGDPNFAILWGDCTLPQAIAFLEHYRRLGFNEVCVGQENSTLCVSRGDSYQPN